MKSISVTIGCILISASLYAQSDSLRYNDRKLRFGVNVSYNMAPNELDAITPELILNKGHHSFLIGPRIFIKKSIFDSEWSRFGGEFNYRYNHNSTSKIFNLFFFYHLDIAAIRKKTQTIYHINTNQYNANYINTRYSVINVAGYGIKLRIVKGFYFNNNIGTGIKLFRDDYKLDNIDDPSLSYYKKGNFLSYGEIAFLFTIGFGYDF